MLNKAFRNIFLFLIGGGAYITIEMVWRAIMNSPPTHFAMIIIGGLAFILIGGVNEWISWDMAFWKQCLFGTVFVLIIELLSGYVLNVKLGLHIWDYSHLPLNILGQVCPQFAAAWYLLSGFGIVLDDWLRYLLFGEEFPHYKLI